MRGILLLSLLLIGFITSASPSVAGYEKSELATPVSSVGSGTIKASNPPQSSDPILFAPTNVQVYNNLQPQDEPSLAVNPTNTQNIVIGYNDYTGGGNSQSGISSTSTGGGTAADWTYQGVIAGGGSLNNQFAPVGDPALAFDSSGNLYYVALTAHYTPSLQTGEIFVRRSTDGGVTYPTLSVISSVTTYTSNHDKPSIAIDTSRTPNKIYVAWTDFNFGGNGAVRLAYADVSPWTPAGWTLTTTAVSGTTGIISPTRTCCTGSAVAIGPNGQVYVAMMDRADNSIRIAASTDNGATFPTQATVDNAVVQFPSNLVPNTDTRTNTFPVIAVDTSTSSARGAIYVAWADYTNGNGDIWIRKSTDGGAMWSARAKVNNDVGTADQFFPALAVHPSNGKIMLVFYDRRDDTTTPNYLMNLYFAFALPNNYPTFTNGLLTTKQSSPDVLKGWGFMGDYIGATVSPGTGSTFDVAWTDLRDGSTTSHDDNSNIYFARFDPDTLGIILWPVFPHFICWRYIFPPYLCFPFIGLRPFLIFIYFWIIGYALANVTLTVRGLPVGVNASFSPQQGRPPFMSVLTLTNSVLGAGIPSGHYSAAVDATNSTGTKQTTNFTFDATPGAFLLVDHYYANPGTNIILQGQGFKPGNSITLTMNNTQLSQKPTADSKGAFTTQITLPQSLPRGTERFTANDGAGNTGNNTIITPLLPITEDDLAHLPIVSTSLSPLGAIVPIIMSFSLIGFQKRLRRAHRRG